MGRNRENRRRCNTCKYQIMKKILLFLSLLFISFMVSLSFLLNFKNKNKEKLKKYATSETNHFITNLVKEIVDSENIYSNNIFKISRNNNNEIEIIDFDTIEVNRILERITKKIESNLKKLENAEIKSINFFPKFNGHNFIQLKKGVLFEFNDDFYNDSLLGTDTKIPIRLSFVGNVYTYISTNIKNYGYNSAYLEVDINVEIKQSIKLPMIDFKNKVKSSYPISLKIIQGTIPNYYSDKFSSNSSSYSLPIKK